MISAIVILLTSILFLITFINLLTARTVRGTNQIISNSVACLIPMRNEAIHAREVISSALEQKNLTDYQVFAIDDHSTDSTKEEIKKITAWNFRWNSSEKLPQGWLGKNFACHQLSQMTEAEYLVFLDADTRLSQDAIASAIAAMDSWGLDYISPYPRQIAIGWLEKLVQPLLQWSWFVSVPLRFAERFRIKSMSVANGQFFIVKNSAYRESGGHEAIRDEVLDDISLARTLAAAGFRGCVADGSLIASCRMYESSRDLINGYAKSQWRAFGNFFGALAISFLLIITSIAPLIAGFLGYGWGWYGFLLIVATRFAVALKTRSALITSLLHPFAALVWIALIKLSWFRKLRGTLSWKGRAV